MRGKVWRMMNEIIELKKKVCVCDLIRVISQPSFPGIVFLGNGAFSFRTGKAPGKPGCVGQPGPT